MVTEQTLSHLGLRLLDSKPYMYTSDSHTQHDYTVINYIFDNGKCFHKQMHMHISVHNSCSLQHTELKMNNEI